MRNLIAVAALAALCVASAPAEDFPARNDTDKVPAGDLGYVNRNVKRAAPRFADAGQNYVAEVLARDAIIPAKGFKAFESSQDFSGASRASFAVTTLDTGSFLINLRIGVGWVVLDFQDSWYIITDVVKGNSFGFTDHGGANVPVAGSAMRLVIWNDGTTPLTIKKLNVYASLN